MIITSFKYLIFMHLLNLQIKIVSFRVKPFSNFIRQIKFKSYTDDYLNKLFDKPGALSAYWRGKILNVTRPAAKNLLSQISSKNELGFESAEVAKKGTLLEYVLSQKKKYNKKIILTRVGEFYETYGVDAIMLVNYCGLNPMGNKAKAGFPIQNIQSALDSLTSEGFSIAVFEEMKDVDAQRGPSAKARIKSRVLTQIVTPGASTYVYDLCLRNEDIEFRDNQPVLGILYTAMAYSIIEVYVEERIVIINERLTLEAAKSLLEVSGSAGIVYTQGDSSALSFLSSYHYQQEVLTGYSSQDFHSQVLRRIGANMEREISDFRVITRTRETRPRALYSSTASQIGLIPNPNIPDLISFCLPPNHSAHSNRFLRRWLLNPPSYKMADHFRELCNGILKDEVSLPVIQPVPVGKIIGLLSARQGNSALFRDILHTTETVHRMIEDLNSPEHSQIISSLAELTSYESGFLVDINALAKGCSSVSESIRNIVLDADDIASDLCFKDPYLRVPAGFFERNEEIFRGCVVRGDSNPVIEQAYKELEEAALHICELINEEFPSDSEIIYEFNNNNIIFKYKETKKSLTSFSDRDQYRQKSSSNIKESIVETARDKNGAVIPKRYTTKGVSHAIREYILSAERATSAVESILKSLSDTLVKDIPIIVQAVHWAVILQAAAGHTVSAQQKGWILPELLNNMEGGGGGGDRTMQLHDLTPYWIDRKRSTPNSFQINGIFLLTAPNMSGKSTLLRSVLVAALLANCGMFVPCSSGSFPRFDNFFIRTASYDIPSEGMSSFALEMDDLKVVLRDSTNRSLVMVDEIGKGTSSKDGAAIAGALLEYLDNMNVLGIFATHLHEIFQLPLDIKRVQRKKMGINLLDSGNWIWTYKLEDGICTDSLALYTAKLYGLPDQIINRASALSDLFEEKCRPRFDSQQNSVDELLNDRKQNENHLNDENQLSSSFADSSDISDSYSQELIKSASRTYSLDFILPSIASLLGLKDIPLIIHSKKLPPISFEGQACVYILHITNITPTGKFKKNASGSKIDVYYVGETESIRQRMSKHRSFWSDCDVSAIIVPRLNKSEARITESYLINELKTIGLQLANDEVRGDGSNRLFSSKNTD